MSTPESSRKGRKAPAFVVALSQVAPERLNWLSPGRLAAGKITILDGDPGLGKSTLLCELAARISRGEPLPGGEPGPPRKVVLMSAEDDLYDTIRPRIDAAGGDPPQIVSFAALPVTGPADAIGKLVVIPDHVRLIEQVVEHTNAALLVIDPLVAFLSGRISANSEQGVRRALGALKVLAERTGVAVVAVRHLNKSLAANPLYRGGGSIGIIGAARCGLLLARDPDDPERRILAATKGNLGRLAPSLAFRLVTDPDSDAARVVWDGESHWSAAQLLRDSESVSQARVLQSEARTWLRAALAGGPRLESALARSLRPGLWPRYGLRCQKSRGRPNSQGSRLRWPLALVTRGGSERTSWRSRLSGRSGSSESSGSSILTGARWVGANRAQAALSWQPVRPCCPTLRYNADMPASGAWPRGSKAEAIHRGAGPCSARPGTRPRRTNAGPVAQW